jgi:hypothetical protein
MSSTSLPFINTASNLLSEKSNLVKILFIFVVILFLFTNLIKINPGHFLAISVTIAVGIFYIQSDVDTNIKLMETLGDIQTPNYEPKFIYLDADLIEAFYSLKTDFYQYNPDTYEKTLKATDSLLRISKDMTTILLPQPEPINNNINFDEPSSPKKETKVTLVNDFENYEVAKLQYKLANNYLNSYIINLPSNPVLHKKFDVITKKIHTLLKKNLDQIYNIYKKNRKVYSRNITDYDLPVPFNGYGKGTTDKSFEYI